MRDSRVPVLVLPWNVVVKLESHIEYSSSLVGDVVDDSVGLPEEQRFYLWSHRANVANAP